MIQLDLLKLNKISPYKVFPSSRKVSTHYCNHLLLMMKE